MSAHPSQGPLLFMLPALKDPPETGGEAYNLHLARALSKHWTLQTLTFADLNVDRKVDAGRFAAAVAEVLRQRVWHGPILQDTYIYQMARSANQWLRRERNHPIIGFGQAVYPERYQSWLSRTQRFWTMRRYLATCDAHIVVSQYMKKVYGRLGVPDHRIGVVYPGFDIDRFSPSPARPPLGRRRLHLVTAGAYIPAKGQDILIEALAILKQRRPELADRVELCCYGHQDHSVAFFSQLSQGVQRHGLADRVQLHGPVPQPELWGHFQKADLFLFPAAGEGLGMVVVEAMLLGCVPVVAYPGPMPELIDDDQNGYVIERTAAAVARTIERIMAEPQRLRMLSVAARNKALAIANTWRDTTDQFAAILSRFLAEWSAVHLTTISLGKPYLVENKPDDN